jgi:hypothetical protein
MARLNTLDKQDLERAFEMQEGYVLNFSDKTFGEFFKDFDIDIHSEKYCNNGTSKAKKLRSFWEQEDDFLVAQVFEQLLRLTNQAHHSDVGLIIDKLLGKNQTNQVNKDIDNMQSSNVHNIIINGDNHAPINQANQPSSNDGTEQPKSILKKVLGWFKNMLIALVKRRWSNFS